MFSLYFGRGPGWPLVNPDGDRGSMVASGRTEETFWIRGDHQIQGHVPELQAPEPITEPELAGWTGQAVTDRMVRSRIQG